MKRGPVAVVGLLTGLVLGGAAGHSFLQGQSAKPAVPAIPRELTSYRDIVKKVLPAVVSVEARSRPSTEKVRQPRRRSPLDEQVPEEFRRFFDFGEGFEAEPQPRLGQGSGFIVDGRGVVVTNNHVVDGADQVIVTLTDGRKFTSRDIKTDPKTDLAIVRIDPRDEPLPTLEFGDSSAMEIGDRVLAVGAPFGLAGTVTHGIISSKGRSLRVNMYEDFLQTDAAINPGNSGGPLINLEGKVIGVNSAIKTRTGGFQGVGLAIASNLARNVMQQLVKDGVVHRGYLGVGIQDIADRELAARLGVPKDGGVLVTWVKEKAPGAKAGLQDGDVIVRLAGKPVHDGRELQMNVASLPLGKPVDLGIIRDGKPMTLEVIIEEQPKDFGNERPSGLRAVPRRGVETVSVAKVGLEVTDLSAEMAERLGFRDSAGALVARVEPGSVADEAGLAAGVLITKVEKKPVDSAEAFKAAVEKGDLQRGLLLQVQAPQNGGTRYVLLKTER